MRVPNEDFVVRIVLVLADAQKRESGRSGNSVSRHPTGHESWEERGDSLSSHATAGTVMRVPTENSVVRIALVLVDAQKRESGRSGNSVSCHPTGNES